MSYSTLEICGTFFVITRYHVDPDETPILHFVDPKRIEKVSYSSCDDGVWEIELAGGSGSNPRFDIMMSKEETEIAGTDEGNEEWIRQRIAVSFKRLRDAIMSCLK
jgi:hypothetical protein